MSTASPAKPRLLLIDDHAGIRGAFSRLLRQDFEVVAVESVSIAMALLAAGERFDALLTDLEMPDCDGFTAIARVATIDARLAKRAVICTGKQMTESERAVHAANGFTIVAKGASTRDDLVGALRARMTNVP
jgi:CheY-like chemotaxis protein